MGSENQKLRKYLLHSLGENEMNKIDLQIISDASLEPDLQLAENDLMEDYLENVLTEEEVKSFENEFLVNDRRRKDLEFLRTMKKRVRIELSPNRTDLITNSEPLWKKFGDLFWNHRGKVLTAAAAVIIVTVYGSYLYTKSWEAKLGSRSVEIAQLNKEDLKDLTKLQSLSTLQLVGGKFRDIETKARLSSNNISPKVLMRLALPSGIDLERSFDVFLLHNDKTIVVLKDIHIYANQAGQEMRLLFPREILEKGDYQIQLSQGEESPIIYSFSVE
jgi:hypothetical protein